MVDSNKVHFKNLNLVESLCNKIACLVYSRTDGDKKVLNEILDTLNSFDYNIFWLKKERGVLLINQCCYLIPPEEVLLASKAVQLFTTLVTKAQLTVEGKTLSLVINWCLECLKHGNQINVFKCLQALVRGNCKKNEEDCHQIFVEILKLSNDFNFDPGFEEICLNCLRCIECIIFSEDYEKEKLTIENSVKYFEVFKNVLFKEKSSSAVNEICYCKILITAMRGIENLIQANEQIMMTELGNILGIVKKYMLHDLSGLENYQIQKIYPSSTSIPEVLKISSQPLKKLRGKYDRRSKKVTMSSITAVEEADDTEPSNNYMGYSENLQQNESSANYRTSDSDFSDSEFSQNTKIKSYAGRVRHCALILLGKVVQKVNPKIFIAYMLSFLPDGSQFLHVRTLITCILKDALPKCRLEALGILTTIISNSRQYFLQADGISKSSFTTFSYTINNIIKELHKNLLLALTYETNSTTIKRTLKCISDLIRCSPYHKLEPGLITNIAKHVKSFLHHKDVTIQIFSLTVFGCIISVEPKVKEVKDIIVNSSQDCRSQNKIEAVASLDDFEICDEDDEEITQEKPWLFEQCLRNLIGENKVCGATTNVELKVESLQILGALVRNFFKETLMSFPNDVIYLIKCCSTKDDYPIRLYTGKFMETVFNSLQFSFCHEDESKRASVSLATLFWESLLPGPVTALIQSPEEPMLRCTGCDCIANVGIQMQNGQSASVQNSLIYDQLPRDKQILCLTLLFSCVRDESPAVRSSGVRALAILILFQSLREDSLFFLDVIDITISAAKDEHSIVRAQASWLLGNLSKAIALNKEEKIEDEVSMDTIAELIKTGVKLANDGPKIKTWAVRGVGKLLQIVNEDFMKKFKELVVESINTLIKNATSGNFMKARWNSCYAIANLLENPVIHKNEEWMSKIFKATMSLVQDFKNFKVRISAGFVLGIPPDRQVYGDFYNEVWSAVLNALENSKNISDFNEYRHRDQLVDQLCLVMCHLVSVMSYSDLNSLQDVLYFHLDNLTHFMAKFQERIVPEKSNILLSATEKINILQEEKNFTVEEKGLIKVLQNIFIND